MTEAQFRQQVIDLARLLGWQAYGTWNSLHSPKGYPDLTLCRPPRVLFVELKTGKRKLTPAQEEWLALLKACPGVEVYLWKPEDWPGICEILR